MAQRPALPGARRDRRLRLARRSSARCARPSTPRSPRPSPAARRRLVRASLVFLLVFAITLSVASWDWGMSLEPEWFSTMYGVYVFAGTFQGGIAAVTVLALLLERQGRLDAPLGRRGRHDLGKLLFAFSTFWAYVWFCQYMLDLVRQPARGDRPLRRALRRRLDDALLAQPGPVLRRALRDPALAGRQARPAHALPGGARRAARAVARHVPARRARAWARFPPFPWARSPPPSRCSRG